MPRSVKEDGSAGIPKDAPASSPESEPETGMPAPDSIISKKPFKSPKGKTYQIIKTNEMDEYDKPQRPKGKRGRSK